MGDRASTTLDDVCREWTLRVGGEELVITAIDFVEKTITLRNREEYDAYVAKHGGWRVRHEYHGLM